MSIDVLLARADTKMALRCIDDALVYLEGAPLGDYDISKTLSLLKVELDRVVGKLEEYL